MDREDCRTWGGRDMGVLIIYTGTFLCCFIFIFVVDATANFTTRGWRSRYCLFLLCLSCRRVAIVVLIRGYGVYCCYVLLRSSVLVRNVISVGIGA